VTHTDTSREAVEALLQGVTEGPWWEDNNEGYGANNIWANHASDDLAKILVAQAVGDSAEAEANMAFIAAARELVPALLARAEAAEAALAAANEDADRLAKALELVKSRCGPLAPDGKKADEALLLHEARKGGV